jgi:hypothetical protein
MEAGTSPMAREEAKALKERWRGSGGVLHPAAQFLSLFEVPPSPGEGTSKECGRLGVHLFS